MADQYDVFVSYSRIDENFVKYWLVPELHGRKLSVAVDYLFPLGSQVPKAITQHVLASTVFLPVYSPAWFKSDYAPQERALARSAGKRELPVLLHACPAEIIANDQVFADLTTSNRDAEFQRLLDELCPAPLPPGGRDPLPPPTIGIQPSSPRPLLAMSLDDGITWPDEPFDLGAIWGLPRNRFVGILAASTSVNLLGALTSVEGTLLAAQGARLATQLPARWWFPIDTLEYPNGPDAPEHLWTTAAKTALLSRDPRVNYLKNNGIPSSVLLGCVLSVNLDDSGDSELRVVENWCRALMQAEWLPRPAAVAVELSAGLWADAESQAHALAVALRGGRSHFLVEAFTVKGTRPVDERRLRHAGGPVSPTVPMESSAAAIASWADELLNAASSARQDVAEQYPALVTLANTCRGQGAEGARASSHQFVRALDDLAPSMDGEVVREVLTLVRRYWPKRFEDLIRACAGSLRTRTRRDALTIAVGSDGLMDAWLDGINWEEPWRLDPAELSRSPNGEPHADFLALGLIRRYQISSGVRVMNALESLRPFLSYSLRAISDLSLGRIDERTFLGRHEAHVLLQAARAGFRFEECTGELTDLSAPDLWWLIGALPPTKERVRALLELNVEQRAVFGLCTELEMQQIVEVPDLVRRILTCRRGRPLPE
jgi:hypothetical protein